MALAVELTDDVIVVSLSDGRTISAPLAWFPRLLHGEPAERANFRLGHKGAELSGSECLEQFFLLFVILRPADLLRAGNQLFKQVGLVVKMTPCDE